MEKIIFIACAMTREAKGIVRLLDNPVLEDILGFKFYNGFIDDKKVIVGISGPGTVNMSSLVSIGYMKYKFNTVINYGMVGGYGNIHKQDLVIVNDCMNVNSYIAGDLSSDIDIDKWDFVTFTDGGEDKLTFYKSDMTLINICRNLEYKNNVFYGRCGSGDVWNREINRIRFFHSKYKIICEDMECASVYQICSRLNIPVISIKGVSDNEYFGEEYDDSVIPLLVNYVYSFICKL